MGKWSCKWATIFASTLTSLIAWKVESEDGLSILETKKCVDYQTSQARYNEAMSDWSSPDCYDFSYTFLGYRVGPVEAVNVQVRNGVAVNGDLRTMTDFFTMIESFCFQSCPEEGAKSCDITYDASSGHPTFIFIDVDEFMADEERVYRIDAFTVVDCPAAQTAQQIDQDEENLVSAPAVCNGWKKIESSLDIAIAAWGSPPCYDYTHSLRGTGIGIEAGTVASVRDGRATDPKDKTIDELLSLIGSSCVDNCPTEGAYSCAASFAYSGYPTFFRINTDQADEEAQLSFVLTDFVLMECISDDQQSNNSAVVVADVEEEDVEAQHGCSHVEKVQEDLSKAKVKWSQPSCYDFVYQRTGQDKVPVKVRAGDPIGATQTIDDFITMIDRECLKRCDDAVSLENGHTFFCEVDFETVHGYPSRIAMEMIRESGTTTQVEVILSDYNAVQCQNAFVRPEESSSPPTQSVTDRPEVQPIGLIPTTSPVQLPEATEVSVSLRNRWDDTLLYLEMYNVSSGYDLENQTSAQYRAASWIAFDDPMNIEVPLYGPSETFVQRFALAVFFFALRGENWKYHGPFLGNSTECAWNFGMVVSENNETDRLGVQCNDGGQVERLVLMGNNLRGQLPSEIGLLSSLKHINLVNNGITGDLPEHLRYVTGLQELVLNSNAIEGSLPNWIADLTRLQRISLGKNMISGALPNALTRLTSLQELTVEQNLLIGTIPGLLNASRLEWLVLHDNMIEGSIPLLACEQNTVQVLDLSKNSLTGPLPDCMFDIPVVDLHGNVLEGTMPQLNNVSATEFLSLRDNVLSGTIYLPVSPELRHLDLSANNFSSRVSNSLDKASNLEELFLGDNMLTAAPLPFIPHLSKLKELSLHGINAVGGIPIWLQRLESLVMLDLRHNQLVGFVPSALARLPNLRFVLLTDNKLSGDLASYLSATGMSSQHGVFAWLTISSARVPEVLLLENNGFIGSLESVCASSVGAYVVADCEEIYCPCCSLCCHDDDDDCHDGFSWTPSFLDGYHRTSYHFNENASFPLLSVAPSVSAAPTSSTNAPTSQSAQAESGLLTPLPSPTYSSWSPSSQPTAQALPSISPTNVVSASPSATLSSVPTGEESSQPSPSISSQPSQNPSVLPSVESQKERWIEILPFVLMVSVSDESFQEADLFDVVETYMTSEMSAIYRSFLRVELSLTEVATRRRRLQTTRLLTMGFSGKVVFDLMPPKHSDFETEQLLIVDNLQGIQKVIDDHELAAELLQIGFGMDQSTIDDMMTNIEAVQTNSGTGSTNNASLVLCASLTLFLHTTFNNM